MLSHLYRKIGWRAIPVTASVFLLFTSVGAQVRDIPRASDSRQSSTSTSASKKKSTARAFGVVEFLPGGATRLVPVALWIDGKYYDASLYGANPEPMALEPGTVYEAESNGEPTGLFVVNAPKQVNGSWVADGRWKPHLAMDEKAAADAAKAAASKPKPKENRAIFTAGPDEGPPVLKRPGSSGSESGSASQSSGGTQTNPSAPADSSSPAPKSTQTGRPTLGTTDSDDSRSSSSSTKNSGGSSGDYDPNRPVLKRSPAPDDARPASASDDDSDRPVLSRPASSSAGKPANPESVEESDPDRPVLSRGKAPASPPQPAPASNSISPGGRGASSAAAKKVSGQSRSYVAVSDASQYPTRSLLYALTPEQRKEKAPAMLALAMSEIRAFAAKRPGPPIPKNAAITDYDLRIFDLDSTNTPTEVLSAKLPVANPNGRPFTYYATIVAHLDINDQPQKVFSQVTDTSHLDAYPRMELIDAIDADANGRGDLLFREYSDVGAGYGLYRVFPYQMEKVFEGGSSL